MDEWERKRVLRIHRVGGMVSLVLIPLLLVVAAVLQNWWMLALTLIIAVLSYVNWRDAVRKYGPEE